jgi:hypothetical protein
MEEHWFEDQFMQFFITIVIKLLLLMFFIYLHADFIFIQIINYVSP